LRNQPKRQAALKATVKGEKTQVAASTTLVPAGVKYPLAGEILAPLRPNSVWAAAKVAKVTLNFVHVDSLTPAPSQIDKNKLVIKPGMEVEVKIPPLDDRV